TPTAPHARTTSATRRIGPFRLSTNTGDGATAYAVATPRHTGPKSAGHSPAPRAATVVAATSSVHQSRPSSSPPFDQASSISTAHQTAGSDATANAARRSTRRSSAPAANPAPAAHATLQNAIAEAASAAAAARGAEAAAGAAAAASERSRRVTS